MVNKLMELHVIMRERIQANIVKFQSFLYYIVALYGSDQHCPLNTKQCYQSISAISRKIYERKNLQERRVLNPGQLGEKRKRYFCVKLPLNFQLF